MTEQRLLDQLLAMDIQLQFDVVSRLGMDRFARAPVLANELPARRAASTAQARAFFGSAFFMGFLKFRRHDTAPPAVIEQIRPAA